jgi:hypothetical protein
MIGLLIRLPLVLAILLPLTWAGVLLRAGDELPLLGGAVSGLELAYPPGAQREKLLAGAARAPSAFPAGLASLGGDHSRLVHAGLVACALHLGVVLRILPITFLLTLCGTCAGLVFRERMRIASGYASPTAAGLGRGAVGAGILWMVLFGLSPLPVSFAWVYLSPAALALGGTLYVANLPLKL